jgi:hypothetical protein
LRNFQSLFHQLAAGAHAGINSAAHATTLIDLLMIPYPQELDGCMATALTLLSPACVMISLQGSARPA